MNLPEKFVENIKEILGDEFAVFDQSLNSKSPVSIRLNPLKAATIDFETDGNIPWEENGVYLSSRPVFTLDPAFHAGAYYVQEASSMFVGYLFKNLVDTSRPLKILDLSAAPGGKSTHLASLLKSDDLLVANEVIKSRVKVLKENLQKWGFPNIIVSNQDPETFTNLEGFFDVVLVDAPCSGEGLFRKNPEAVKEWSDENVQMCSSRQRRILSAAGLLVAPGGLLLYSTCTYNPLENQENADWLTRTFNFENVNLEVPEQWGIVNTNPGWQFFPHKVRGEGFYIAAFRSKERFSNFVKAKPNIQRLAQRQTEALRFWIKTEEFDHYDYFLKQDGVVTAIRKSLFNSYGSVLKALQKRSSGLELGLFKGDKFIPDHSFALSALVSDTIPRIHLNKENALLYLKKENFDIESQTDGWAIVCYKNLNLGWVKVIGDRVNNYLPTEWRIKMDLEI